MGTGSFVGFYSPKKREIHEYKAKEECLQKLYEKVTPADFYRDMFPNGSFENEGCQHEGKANGIVTCFKTIKDQDAPDGLKTIGMNRLVFDDLAMFEEAAVDYAFAITSPVSYYGNRRNAKMASLLYGIAIDLDGVEVKQLEAFIFQAQNSVVPTPTYIVNSGHGLHLYYLLEEPIRLYRHLENNVREFKYALIRRVWNPYTSTYKEKEQVQYQGVYQGFRVVGGPSKLGRKYPVTAYRFGIGQKVTVEYLNEFIYEKEQKLKDFTYEEYEPNLTLASARVKYPEWYEKRVIKGKSKGRWTFNRAMYDRWLERIRGEASFGHRYWCLAILSTLAVKCDIDEEELTNDILSLIPIMNSIDPTHPFTEDDGLAAMGMYAENYVYYSRKVAEKVTNISIPPSVRRKKPLCRDDGTAFKAARMIQSLQDPDGEWRNKDGRPKGSGTAQEKVQLYRQEHPDARKVDCVRDTGLSKPTVYKWWDAPLS